MQVMSAYTRKSRESEGNRRFTVSRAHLIVSPRFCIPSRNLFSPKCIRCCRSDAQGTLLKFKSASRSNAASVATEVAILERIRVKSGSGTCSRHFVDYVDYVKDYNGRYLLNLLAMTAIACVCMSSQRHCTLAFACSSLLSV